MAPPAYAAADTFLSRQIPQVWRPRSHRAWFGDIALVVFLLAQCFDGVLTYVGVLTYGVQIEANPIIVALMDQLGHGTALMTAKIVAAVLGIGLHLKNVHNAVALLALFYLVVAVGPWVLILF
jgi:uncharacterized membrane protein